jgi:hypothetical protein
MVLPHRYTERTLDQALLTRIGSGRQRFPISVLWFHLRVSAKHTRHKRAPASDLHRPFCICGETTVCMARASRRPYRMLYGSGIPLFSASLFVLAYPVSGLPLGRLGYSREY